MNRTKRILSKIFIVLIWSLYVGGSGQKSSEYVVFYTHGNTIHKCRRQNYIEYKQMIFEFDDKYDQRKNYYDNKIREYKRWEKLIKFKNRKGYGIHN